MKENNINRRNLLKVSGAGAALLSPLVRAATAMGAEDIPKRLIIWKTPNGVIPNAWHPTGTETNWNLSPSLSPLAAHKDDLLVFNGLQIKRTTGPDGAHETGENWLLTNRPMLDVVDENNKPIGFASGISIDQYIANQLNLNLRFKSLELGVRVRPNENWHTLNYAGSNQPLPYENDARKAFDRIFSGVVNSSSTADPNQQQRYDEGKSMLDHILADLNLLRSQLSSQEMAKIDLHMNAIREMEKGLVPPTVTATCTVPERPPALQWDSHSNFPEIGRRQMDNIVQALGCQLTNIATIQWQRAVGHTRFSWLANNDTERDIFGRGHHSMSHHEGGDRTQYLQRIDTWFSEQLNYLINKLKSIPEGNGTVFDNTVIFVCNEISEGSHKRTNMPFLLAGGCGGYFKTGRLMQYNNDFHGKLLVSLAHAMGVPINSFGVTETSNGPLSGLT